MGLNWAGSLEDGGGFRKIAIKELRKSLKLSCQRKRGAEMKGELNKLLAVREERARPEDTKLGESHIVPGTNLLVHWRSQLPNIQHKHAVVCDLYPVQPLEPEKR